MEKSGEDQWINHFHQEKVSRSGGIPSAELFPRPVYRSRSYCMNYGECAHRIYVRIKIKTRLFSRGGDYRKKESKLKGAENEKDFEKDFNNCNIAVDNPAKPHESERILL